MKTRFYWKKGYKYYNFHHINYAVSNRYPYIFWFFKCYFGTNGTMLMYFLKNMSGRLCKHSRILHTPWHAPNSIPSNHNGYCCQRYHCTNYIFKYKNKNIYRYFQCVNTIPVWRVYDIMVWENNQRRILYYSNTSFVTY